MTRVMLLVFVIGGLLLAGCTVHRVDLILMNGTRIQCENLTNIYEGGGFISNPTIKASNCDGKIYQGTEIFDWTTRDGLK